MPTEIFGQGGSDEEASDDTADRVSLIISVVQTRSLARGTPTSVDSSDDVGVDLCISVFLKIVHKGRISLNRIECRRVVAVDRLIDISLCSRLHGRVKTFDVP